MTAEDLLREAVTNRQQGDMCFWCKTAYWRPLPGLGDIQGVTRDGHNVKCPAVLLLAEIDAAKASG